MVILALMVGLLAARPVMNRLRASRDQSYSARFRTMTWAGVRDMIAARPLMGVGPGAFDVRYPRYARVGYTQHAHNSYLQAAAETGIPGMALLLGAMAAVLAAGVRGLRTLPRADGPEHDGIILAGLIAGMVGAAVHNVFDSDLYVPAIACVFAALCGLIVAWSRPANAGQRRSSRIIPSPIWRVPVGLLGVALLGAGSLTVPARLWVADASAAMAAGDVYGALDAYRHAARLDPLEPENALAIAFVLNGLDEKEAARRELIRATRLADIGKTWYRLGKHYLAEANPDEAVRALERARRADPMHLRSQLALAQAYALAGRPSEARRIYEGMVALHRSPVGQIRAIPEVPDWEYGIAYAAIAETALREGKAEEALANLDEAKTVLGDLWRLRNEPMVRIRITDDVLREVEARYTWVLEQRTTTLRRLGRNDEADAAAIELRRLQREKEEAAERAEP
jgi:tetratricopeptide (TPR) repeat protein